MSSNKDFDNVDHAEATDGLSQQRLRNRMAQRKYRKKLKLRIEDLEKRAAGCNDAGNSEPTTFQSLESGGMEHQFPQHQATEPGHTIPMPPLIEPLGIGKQGALSKNMEQDTLQEQQLDQAMMYDFRLPSTPSLNAWQAGPYLSHSGFLATDSNGSAASKIYLSEPLAPSCEKPPSSDPGLSDKSTAEVAYVPPDKAYGAVLSNTKSVSTTIIKDSRQMPTQSDRMKLVLECTRSAGFGTFDSAVVEYYTEEFEKGTNVYNAQKMSRQRHLPNVLRSLRDSAREWTQWEAAGYKGEILRSAEAILVEEFERVLHVHIPGASGERSDTSVANENSSPGPSPPESLTDSELTSILGSKLKMEDELPNLWSLVIALTTNDSSSSKQSTRHQVLLDCLYILGHG